MGLHDLGTVDFIGQALVNLEKRDHTLGIPEVISCALPFDFPVHGVFKQYCSHYSIAVERRTGYDAGTHGVYNIEHFVVVVVGIGSYAVIGQGLGSTASTLIQGSDESGFVSDLVKLLIVVGHGLIGFQVG